jgi:hypothetical protein
MPYLNIHWKGYPHHRLPRIRLPSTRRASARSRSISQARPALGKRKSRFFRVRRRRALSRSSHTSSIALRARRRVSVRARHNIQAFGWDTDLAGQASTVSASTIRAGPKSNHLSVPQDTVAGSTVIEFESTDGAASSTVKAAKPQQENAYSLKRVAEVPVYWTKSSKPLDEILPSITSNCKPSAAKTGEEYCDCEPIGGTWTYDPRIGPKSPTGTRSKSIAPQQKSTAATRRPTATSRVSAKEKQQSKF